MTSIDPAKVLSYGAIGLGFLLAFLAYLLLSTEQKLLKPRQSVIRAIYSFMLFAFLLSLVGFGSEIIKNWRPTEALAKNNFTQVQPLLRSPPNGSEHNNYPRDLEVAWEAVADAVSYRVETEIQVEIMGENRYEWEALDPQRAFANHCQVHIGGDTWARWRVVAFNATGQESQPSDWWTFHFWTKK